jgi:hypothetical protein
MKTITEWISLFLKKTSEAEVAKSILVKLIFHHEPKSIIEEDLLSEQGLR